MIALHATTGCLPRDPTVVPGGDLSAVYAPMNATTKVLPPPNQPPFAAAAREMGGTESLELPPELQVRVRPRAWKYIVLHHSATTDGDVRAIDIDHRQRTDSAGEPWLGIGYHFVIGNGRSMGDGTVEATFRWRDQLQGAHAGSRLYNEQGIGICLIGDFDRSPPTPSQMTAAKRLVTMLRTQFAIPARNCIRHCDVQSTECPGRLFPLGAIVGTETTEIPINSARISR
jgi:hypothetical protein